MAKVYSFIKQNGDVTQLVSLSTLMAAAGRQLVKGEGLFTLTKNGDQLGHERTRSEALDALSGQLSREGGFGHAWRVRNAEGVQFTCREVQPAAKVIDTSGNKLVDETWTALIDQFGEDNVVAMGFYVCKADSQHAYGNAGDAGNKQNARIYDMAEFAVDNAKKYDIRNVIVGNQWWHVGVGWRPYGGVPHVSHIHWDHDPMFDTGLPCGVRG